ncbi:fam-a protein [Plasmodium vinckei brucechwatti]|uniref:Fam-a protein n=1 Tax=Plasmodium vinckei brucechwatti TaxID=119398 RepID=A0A6V7S0J0_PLAVN|nr:fam-a protein [Plasmodium vinckei brucechwatti]
MKNLYIQIVLFLLSVSVNLNNKALATDPTPGKFTTPKPPDRCLTSEEIFEKNKHLLCNDPKEIKNAEELMNEAVKHLERHATDTHDYKICENFVDSDMNLYKKKHEGHIDINKIDYTMHSYYDYNDIINEIWDPDTPNVFNNGDVKIVRVYNPNLVMIQHRYKKKSMDRQKYFYALATKTQISEGKTIIAMTSANINDHNPSGKKYENKIVQKANSFTTDINSEEDIKNGELKKVFVNIAGYLIEKKNRYADATYVESIDGHDSIKCKAHAGFCCFYYYTHA